MVSFLHIKQSLTSHIRQRHRVAKRSLKVKLSHVYECDHYQVADYCTHTSPGEPISVVLLVDAVKKVNDWHNLGLHLYLEETKLEEIGITYNGVGRIKAELFKVWLKSNPDASWDKLVAALNSIGEKSVAAEVESKYCKQLPGILEYFT